MRASSLDVRARKLLSFTDNRQDASLQAGHFNDFIEIGLLRSALHCAVQRAGVLRQVGPPGADGVEQRLPGVARAVLVDQVRQPRRQVGVLHRHDGAVAASLDVYGKRRIGNGARGHAYAPCLLNFTNRTTEPLQS